MEKYLINKDEFNVYFGMLQSDDVTIVKEGVQRFSDAFAQKRHILGSYRELFCNYLEKLLTVPEYCSIRKWILKCGCYYSTPKIEDICKRNFFTTDDAETQNWMISVIASRYTNIVEFSEVIDRMRRQTFTEEQAIMLDRKNVFYNASIFGKFSRKYETEKFGEQIFRENDRNGKFWIAKLAAYPELAQRKNLFSLIKKEDIERMTFSDDSEVQVYAYWGMVHHAGGELKLFDEEKKEKNRTLGSLKWYYTGIIPGEYANKNLDYITNLLKSVNEKHGNDIRAKEGILNGLNKISYNPYFDGLIIEWYYMERFQKIKMKILEYMIKNAENNAECENSYHGKGSFFEIILDEWLNTANAQYIKKYIDLYKTLEYKVNNGDIELRYRKEEPKMSTIYIPGANFYGSVNLGDNGKIVTRDDCAASEKLLVESLQAFIKECTDEKLVAESRDMLESYEGNKRDWKSKALVLNSHLADFVTILAATPQVIQIAKNIMQYIGKII